MESIAWVADNFWTVLLTGVAISFAGVIFQWTKPDPEAAVDFEVPLPPQCQPGWKGQVLEKPSLKVCTHA